MAPLRSDVYAMLRPSGEMEGNACEWLLIVRRFGGWTVALPAAVDACQAGHNVAAATAIATAVAATHADHRHSTFAGIAPVSARASGSTLGAGEISSRVTTTGAMKR